MMVSMALRNKEKAKLGGGGPPTNWHRSSEKIMTEKRIVDADALDRKRWRQDDDDHYYDFGHRVTFILYLLLASLVSRHYL